MTRDWHDRRLTWQETDITIAARDWPHERLTSQYTHVTIAAVSAMRNAKIKTYHDKDAMYHDSWSRYMMSRAHKGMSHVTHMNESWVVYTKEWVVSHIWMSHESCRVHKGMSHVTHTNESLVVHTKEWVMSHIWMSHVSLINATLNDGSLDQDGNKDVCIK